ncbi:MAG: hypothetical protein IT548_09665 [Alphaproteobacteria bacterium]|nr:hypothetical protein [Alphaproteobacteria bacterium]
MSRNDGNGADRHLPAQIAGDIGEGPAALAVRGLLLDTMALGSLYLQRLVLEPAEAKAADIPGGVQKMSQAIAALGCALRVLAVPESAPAAAAAADLPALSVSPAASRRYRQLSAHLAEARAAAAEADEDPDAKYKWGDPISALEKELFERAGYSFDEK